MKVNPQQQQYHYINHILNTSYSKNSCKFAKSSRFPQSNRIQTEYSYQVQKNDSRNERGCSMGFGNRTNFENSSKTPASNFYNLKLSDRMRTTKLGLGRTDVKFRSFLNDCVKKGAVCSQYSYNLGSTIRKKPISLHKRLITELDIKTKTDIPGPSAYILKSHCISGKGKYMNSKFKSSRMTVMLGLNNQQQMNKNKLLGPGSYNIHKSLGSNNSKANYCKYEGFGSSQRYGPIHKHSFNIPGPGHYRIFSQFSNMENCSPSQELK